MALDTWLPIGFPLPDGDEVSIGLYEGADWQIYRGQNGHQILVAKQTIVKRWVETGLLETGAFKAFAFGEEEFFSLASPADQTLAPVARCASPNTKNEALAFADALRSTRKIDGESCLQDGLYIERYSRILPTYTLSVKTSDEVVFGAWLTGGIPVSVKSFRRLKSCMTWIGTKPLEEVVTRGGFALKQNPNEKSSHGEAENQGISKFELLGRPGLESFFTEHVIDIIENQARYESLGITFPSAIVLYGPPGCGKTFAVERLVDYLGWPSFEIDASSVGSPFIHETSKKVAELFDRADRKSVV